MEKFVTGRIPRVMEELDNFRTEIRGQNTEIQRQNTEIQRQNTEIGEQKDAIWTRVAEQNITINEYSEKYENLARNLRNRYDTLKEVAVLMNDQAIKLEGRVIELEEDIKKETVYKVTKNDNKEIQEVISKEEKL